MNSKVMLMIIRIGWLIALIGGSIYWWTSSGVEDLPLFHVLLGGIVTAALLILVFQAYKIGAPKSFIILAAVWAIGLPLWGVFQMKIFPDNMDWVAQILHVICAIGAIGIAEILGAQIERKKNRI